MQSSDQNLSNLRTKFNISLSTPPMDTTAFEKSPFILIRHALSTFNMNHLIALDTYGKGSPEMDTFDNDINGFDPELHPIGV